LPTTSTYTVSGMTCTHCVSAVTEAVARIEGVMDVGIDLASGRVTVESARAIDDDEVAVAVDEAGYAVIS
jgi:copper chaperone